MTDVDTHDVIMAVMTWHCDASYENNCMTLLFKLIQQNIFEGVFPNSAIVFDL